MALSLPPLAAAALHIGFGPVLTGYPSLETITTKIKDIYMERVLKGKRHEKNLPYFSFLILLPKNQMDVLYIFLCSSSHHTHLQRLLQIRSRFSGPATATLFTFFGISSTVFQTETY